MANLGNFDAREVDPIGTYEVIPPGKYLAQIVASEMRATRDGMGQYLWLELDILEGPYAGRKLFDRLNLVNTNPTTVEIAQRTLSAICHACGRMQVRDSEELHLIPMALDVRVKPPKGDYGESNVIRYLPRESAPPATAPVQTQQEAPQPAAKPAQGFATAPWKRA
ncbi:MAG: hypothetical protein Kow00104_01210 [Rhodothalassiaceae bacterium]